MLPLLQVQSVASLQSCLGTHLALNISPTGDMSEVERRMYLPQWLQHKYFHHLFMGEFPEFGLERTSHQWFNSANWPQDFRRQPGREADYYAEAVNKRFLRCLPQRYRKIVTRQFH